MEIGILPMSLRVCLPEARNEWCQGWTQWTSSQFTTPFARTEENRFSELPELANIDFFRSEMTKFVDSIRSGADVAVPASAALDVALVVDACYRSEQSQGADTALAVPAVASPHANPRRRRTRNNPHPGPWRGTLWQSGWPPPVAHQPHSDLDRILTSNGRYITPRVPLQTPHQRREKSTPTPLATRPAIVSIRASATAGSQRLLWRITREVAGTMLAGPGQGGGAGTPDQHLGLGRQF